MSLALPPPTPRVSAQSASTPSLSYLALTHVSLDLVESPRNTQRCFWLCGAVSYLHESQGIGLIPPGGLRMWRMSFLGMLGSGYNLDRQK